MKRGRRVERRQRRRWRRRVRALVVAGTQPGCGTGAAGPHHTTAGGGGRAAAAGPQRPRAGRGTETGPRLVRLRPAGGGGAGPGSGWARRRGARLGARAHEPVFLRAVTRALCGPPVARCRSTCASPLALSCGPWARAASGARASPRPPGCAARALLLVGRAVPSARRTPPPSGGPAAWRTSDSLRGERGGLGPSCFGDVRGCGGLGPQRNLAALLSGLRLRSSARQTRLLVLTEECCHLREAHVLGGCLGRVLPCFGNGVLLAREGIGSPWVFSPCTGAL